MYLKAPQTNRAVGSFTGQTMGSPDAQRVTTGRKRVTSGRSNPASGAPEEATCQLIDPRVLISNGQIQTTGRDQVSTRRVRYTPDPYVERLFIAWGHRTHSERPMFSVKLTAEVKPHRTQEQGLAHVRCTQLTSPDTDSTPDVQAQRPMHAVRASGECFAVRNTPATSPKFPPMQ